MIEININIFRNAWVPMSFVDHGENERLRKSLCIYCKRNPRAADRFGCSKCLRKRRLNARVKRSSRKLIGLCADCNNSVYSGRMRCSECLGKRRRNDASLLERRQSLGLCWKCKNPAIPGRTYCFAHLKKMRINRSNQRRRRRKLAQVKDDQKD